MVLYPYITSCQSIMTLVVCLKLGTDKFEEDISMDDASMSAESNDVFMDMVNLSDYFTGNTLNMLRWQ